MTSDETSPHYYLLHCEAERKKIQIWKILADILHALSLCALLVASYQCCHQVQHCLEWK